MFIDRARIKVTGGGGGKGCCSFRREKYVPHGGPDGGDGGNGGDVLIVANSRLSSLMDLRYHSTWKGNRGAHGRGSNCHGKCGEDIFITVPPGTIVHDLDSDSILADLKNDGDSFRAGRGGRGGKGNARFATSTNRIPQFAEIGEPGEEASFALELKLIAEVGLVGLPNAGKSTLLSTVTAAKPKIASYPFTTLSPNLGVAFLSKYRMLTIADIPGIIEGAAEGKGLGHDFLRHIERTRVLLFLIDLGDEEPLKTIDVLERELAEHSGEFAARPRVYALNKIDIPDNLEKAEKLKSKLADVFLISGAGGEGVNDLMEHIHDILERVRREDETGEVEEVEHEYTYEAPFTIKEEDGVFQIEGRTVLRFVRMTDFENEEAVRYLQEKLKKMGIFKALKRMGASEGQSIFIGTLELEYHAE